MGNNCTCNEKKESNEKEIYNEEDIKRMEENFNKRDNNDTPHNSNLNEESLNNINSNEKNNEINQFYYKKYGIDLTEPIIEKLEYEDLTTSKENENINLKSKKNLNTTNSNKTNNSNKLNSETDGGIYSPNTLNNNPIQQLKKKGVNQNTLKLFNISKKNIFHKSDKKQYYNNNNNNYSNIRKVQTQYSNPNNLSKGNIIEGINNLNEIFLNERKNINNAVNNEWKNLDINNIISQTKLNSIDPEEILFNSNIYKLVLSSLFRICSMNIEQFLILIKDKILIYQNKENFLLMKKPQREFDLINIESCGRIDLCTLNIHYLQGYFYMYIEIKDDNIHNDNNNNNENHVIDKIIQKEQEGNFYVFFSKDELLINQWVCVINCFIKPNSQKTTEKQ